MSDWRPISRENSALGEPRNCIAEQEPPDFDGNVLDMRELLDRCMGQLDFAERILGKFCSRLDDDLATLEQAVAQNDVNSVVAMAHRIKGSAANSAAHSLRNEAAAIEQLARGSCLDDLPARLVRLRAEQSRLLKSAALLS